MLDTSNPIRTTFAGEHSEHKELQCLLKELCPTPGTLRPHSILAVQLSFQLTNTTSPHPDVQWCIPNNVVWCGGDERVRILPWYTLQIENPDFQSLTTKLARVFSLQSHFWCQETHQNAKDMIPKEGSLGTIFPFSLFLAPGLGVLVSEDFREGPEDEDEMDFFLQHHSRIQIPKNLTAHQKMTLTATPMITNLAHIVAPFFKPGTIEPVPFEHPLP
jgi:hypothetical protein